MVTVLWVIFMKNNELIKRAINAMNNSYSPYSGFRVGAAILCDNNKVYTGCNIENASYSVTNCAERTALFKAISEGETRFKKIAIVGGKNGIISDYISPCGVCRQVLAEFCDESFIIILAKSENDYKEYTLKELLPISFKNESMV